MNLKKTKVKVSGSKSDVLKSKVDKCGKRVMCTKCGKWVHGRCAKMKRVTLTLANVLFVKYVLMQRNCGTKRRIIIF